MSDFDYMQFTKSYLGDWTNPHVKKGLKKIPLITISSMETRVNLIAKDLLSNVKNVTRKDKHSGTLVVRFANVDSKLNSDCLVVVEEYLRVFLCERGYARSYEDSLKLMGFPHTEFSGLAFWEGKVNSGSRKAADKAHKEVHIEIKRNGKFNEMMEEAVKAFGALTTEIKQPGPGNPKRGPVMQM